MIKERTEGREPLGNEENNEKESHSIEPERYDPTRTPWEKIVQRVSYIENANFPGEDGYTDEELRAIFEDSNFVIILLRDEKTDELIGYSYAQDASISYDKNYHPERLPYIRAFAEKGHRCAYIENTAIDPKYIGQGLVGPLIAKLEAELRKEGFVYYERDASDTPRAEGEKSYADKIFEFYSNNGRLALDGGQVMHKIHGPQRLFGIRL